MLRSSTTRRSVHAMLWVAIASAGTSSESAGGQSLPTGSGPPVFLKGALASSQLGKAVVLGELTGDADIDAVVLDSAVPALLIRPEVFGTAIHAAITANDLALLPVTNDDRASVIAVGSSGLTRLRFDSATGVFVATPIALSGWTGATRVAVGQLDGSGGFDLAAVASDGKILTAYSSGSTFVNGSVLTPWGLAYGIDLFDATGDGDDEISLLTTNGTAIYESNFTLLYNYATPGMTLISTVIPTPSGSGSTRESIAIVATIANGNQYLRVFSSTGLTPVTNLGVLGAVSVSAGDRDLDGDADLTLSVRTAAGFVTRANTAPLYGNPAFASASTTISFCNQSRNPALNNSGIGLADFDHDGDLDTFALAQGEYPAVAIYSDFAVVRNSTVSQAAFQPSIPDVKFRFFEVFDTTGGTPGGGGTPGSTQGVSLEGVAEVEYSLTTPAPLPNAPAGTRKYELTVWRTASLLGPTVGTTTTPFVATKTIAMNPSGTTFWTYVPPEDFLPSGAAMTLVVRQIVVDANGVVLARGPSESVVQSGEDDYDVVPNLFGAAAAQLVTPEFADGSHHETPDGAVGTVVTGPRVPDFDPNARPSGT